MRLAAVQAVRSPADSGWWVGSNRPGSGTPGHSTTSGHQLLGPVTRESGAARSIPAGLIAEKKCKRRNGAEEHLSQRRLHCVGRRSCLKRYYLILVRCVRFLPLITQNGVQHGKKIKVGRERRHVAVLCDQDFRRGQLRLDELFAGHSRNAKAIRLN